MPIYTFSVNVGRNNIGRIMGAMPEITERTLEQIGDAVIKNIKRYVPVDTGALRDSYIKEVIPETKTLRVGSPLEYAPFVELGAGPNYEEPPGWVFNYAQRGHHDIDPWWYLDDDGEWKLGWFVQAQPHLRPAFLNHVREYQSIFRRNLQNG